MKFGTPATQALIAFASVALLSSLRTASAAPLPVCDSPTTPIDNEGAVLVRFWNELVKSKNQKGADCPFECGDEFDYWDDYVALDETEDKSDCKSNNFFPDNSLPMSTKGGTCGGDGDSFSVDLWFGSCACDGEATLPDTTLYSSKCVVVNNSEGYLLCSKIIDYTACEVTTTTTTSTTSTSTTTTTPEPKFWPDWLGADTCVFSEKYPQYMQLNPTWTGSTLEDCCKRYYSWRYDDCLVEGGGTSTAANTATLYYPDWEGSDHVCVNDGEAPDYITQAASVFMFEDLEDCCEKYYWWNLAECLGSAANAGSNKYYADYSQSKCVKDCTESDCGGLVGGVWDELYDDKSSCCAEKFWWVEDCDA
eukprot:g2096.t1 g2096   contig11:711293-713012(+)